MENKTWKIYGKQLETWANGWQSTGRTQGEAREEERKGKSEWLQVFV